MLDVVIQISRVNALQEPAQVLNVPRSLDLLGRCFEEFPRSLRIGRDNLNDSNMREFPKIVLVLLAGGGIPRKIEFRDAVAIKIERQLIQFSECSVEQYDSSVPAQ